MVTSPACACTHRCMEAQMWDSPINDIHSNSVDFRCDECSLDASDFFFDGSSKNASVSVILTSQNINNNPWSFPLFQRALANAVAGT